MTANHTRRAAKTSSAAAASYADERSQPLDLPRIHDACSVLEAISAVVAALGAGTLEPARARVLLYALQVAGVNAHRVAQLPEKKSPAPAPRVEPPAAPLWETDPEQWRIEQDAEEEQRLYEEQERLHEEQQRQKAEEEAKGRRERSAAAIAPGPQQIVAMVPEQPTIDEVKQEVEEEKASGAASPELPQERMTTEAASVPNGEPLPAPPVAMEAKKAPLPAVVNIVPGYHSNARERLLAQRRRGVGITL
ncbi:MAG: hypothetical protein PW789_16445 [Edaphobacter sp.]|uniref:hypothetical protein n=1 Tax=Edaphobacter sp. TaxID=1934404 RepID=UPI00239653B6|nr:hypothetical protein [Edaphobacter sp.]MDE1178164.1 hypothetical protein [Edaphobacter sp.]